MNYIDLSKAVFNHLKEIAPEIKHYYGILAMIGGLKTAEASGDDAYAQEIVRMLSRFPDEVDTGFTHFPSYRIGGIARAYALFKGYMTDERTVALIREYAEELMTAPRDRKGIVKNTVSLAREIVWIDCAAFVTPYLLYAGLALNEPAWVDEAVKQTLLMYDEFLDPVTGLLHQSRGEIAQGVISKDHWGRGNGWGYFAMTELLQYLPKEHPERWRVEEYFGRHSYAMLLCQTENFVWRQELDEPNAYEEATATGLILYGFGVGRRLDYLHINGFQRPYENGLEAMTRIFLDKDFRILNVCPGCRTPGRGKEMGSKIAYMNRFPVIDDLHGFGPLQLAYAEAALHEL